MRTWVLGLVALVAVALAVTVWQPVSPAGAADVATQPTFRFINGAGVTAWFEYNTVNLKMTSVNWQNPTDENLHIRLVDDQKTEVLNLAIRGPVNGSQNINVQLVEYIDTDPDFGGTYAKLPPGWELEYDWP